MFHVHAQLLKNQKNTEGEQTLNIQNTKGTDGAYRYTREFLLYLRDSPLSKAEIKLELFVKYVRETYSRWMAFTW